MPLLTERFLREVGQILLKSTYLRGDHSTYYFMTNQLLQLLGWSLLSMLKLHTAITVWISEYGACRLRRSVMVLALLMKLHVQLQLLFQRKDGATAIEYLILVAIVALVLLAAGTTLGPQITAFFERIGDAISTP